MPAETADGSTAHRRWSKPAAHVSSRRYAQRGIDLHRREHPAGVRVHCAGGVSTRVWINSDDDQAVDLPSNDFEYEAVDDTPTSSSGRRSNLC